MIQKIRWYDQLNSDTEDKTDEIRWYDQLNSEKIKQTKYDMTN